MIRLIHNELVKIFSVMRSYIGFGLIAILMPLILWAYGLGTDHVGMENLRPEFDELFFFVGNITNGFTAAYFIMNFFYIHIPFLIVLVGGDVFAGEAARGTFRIYATRPISRLAIFISKVIASSIYTFLLLIFIVIMSLGLGLIWHGGGDMLVFHDGILILSQQEAWYRFILAYSLSYYNMVLVFVISIFFSVIVRNAVGPVVGAMAIIIFSFALTGLPLEIFDNIRPYIFTTYFDTWKYAFYEPIGWYFIREGLTCVTVYLLVFLGLSATIFCRKDILS